MAANKEINRKNRNKSAYIEYQLSKKKKKKKNKKKSKKKSMKERK